MPELVLLLHLGRIMYSIFVRCIFPGMLLPLVGILSVVISSSARFCDSPKSSCNSKCDLCRLDLSCHCA
jgi:hypothetical protein